MSNVRLRPARLGDLGELALMSLGLNPRMSLEQHRARVERELASHQTLLIINAQAVAGYLVFCTRQDRDDGSTVAELHRLYVKPEYRRKGVARAAMSLLAENYLTPPVQLFLSVNIDRKDARAFYQAVGFEEVFITMKKIVKA